MSSSTIKSIQDIMRKDGHVERLGLVEPTELCQLHAAGNHRRRIALLASHLDGAVQPSRVK